MWENEDGYRSGHKHKFTGENMHTTRTAYRERDANTRMDGKTFQKYGNTHNYTATNSRNVPYDYTDTRNTPQQRTTTESRNTHQNDSLMTPISGMMVSGASSSMPLSQPLCNMPPPGYSNNRLSFNVPPPGFHSTNVPPAGFNNTNVPPPGFNSSSMAPPGFNSPRVPLPGFNNQDTPSPGFNSTGFPLPSFNNAGIPPGFTNMNTSPLGINNTNIPPGVNTNIPPPGYTDQRMLPPEYINNMVPRPGIGPPPLDNSLIGGIPTYPAGRIPHDTGIYQTSSVDLNKSQQNNTAILPPVVIHNQGLLTSSVFPANQNNISLQQGLPHDTSGLTLVSVNEQSETRMADQNWVNNFQKGRKLVSEKATEIPKVSEAKQMLQKWFQLINEMEAQHDKLSERIKSGDSEWQREMQKTNFLKEELLQVESEFSSQHAMDSLQKEIKKKKRKREWRKKQKRNLAIKKKEVEERNFELHLQIDQWREKEIAKDQAKFKAASMKKEAGGVLDDVRRKQAESSKALSLLEALKKLRNFRKQEGELKGVYPKPFPEQNREFDQRLAFLEKLMKKHCELYESEEKTLVVMLAEEEEEKEKERRKKKHTKQLAEAAASDSSDPMREFYRYYTQAENGLDSLLHIRHGWDVYVVPETLPGASCIPQGNITPVRPSSKYWSKFLKDNG